MKRYRIAVIGGDHIGPEVVAEGRCVLLELYVNLRPARLLPGITSPLRDPGDVDMVIVRENTEGEYSGIGGRLHVGTPLELGMQAIVVTRAGAERTLRFAFELARTRRRRLACITKGSALGVVMGVWTDAFEELAAGYPDVETERLNVDAMSMYLLTRPSSFDVVVATNLMGDILSDLAAQVVGGIGIAASANLDPTRRNPSPFEPIHGSAPDIAGRGLANPLAAIRAAGLMLDWLGEASAAQRIEDAAARVFAAGDVRTGDLGGTASTGDVTDAVLRELQRT